LFPSPLRKEGLGVGIFIRANLLNYINRLAAETGSQGFCAASLVAQPQTSFSSLAVIFIHCHSAVYRF
jgi:hypothetical protein